MESFVLFWKVLLLLSYDYDYSVSDYPDWKSAQEEHFQSKTKFFFWLFFETFDTNDRGMSMCHGIGQLSWCDSYVVVNFLNVFLESR